MFVVIAATVVADTLLSRKQLVRIVVRGTMTLAEALRGML